MGRYVDVDDLKKYVKSETSYDEDLYELAILAAERRLDTETGRYIAVAGATATARVYRPTNHRSTMLFIHDCVAITSVVDNGATLTADVDYIAEPLNGLSPSGEARPFDTLRRYSNYWYWDEALPTVTVTARWGWAAIPDMAKTACVIAAKAYLDNRDLSFGIVGAAEFGGITEREAKIVNEFIRQYKNRNGMGIA